jgi:hypothetical protein
MSLLSSFAIRLAKTEFGQKSLTKPGRLSILKQQNSTRVYMGLFLLATSFLISLPTLAFLSYLSVKLTNPMIIAIGGPVVLLLVHIMFGVGVYMAGKNYASELLQWATKRFLQKYA